MHEAMLYDKLGGRRVRCRLCAHGCTIEPGARGICAVRENVDGTLRSLVYGVLIARDVDPIEKKPLFHFLPGSRAYSIATVGCNFRCLHCQNHYISQYPREHRGRIVGEDVAPGDVVSDALAQGCLLIAYTYNEPTVAAEFALDTMKLAHEDGLANAWVSNGYLSADGAGAIAPYLDAINIDLKGISDRVHHETTGGNVRPVLDTIERMVDADVWVEVTTLVIPGINDGEDELRWTAEAIYGISPSIPWHISRFFPAYRMLDRPPTPVATLKRARQIGRDVGLRYIYLGNLPGDGEVTHCPECSRRIIERVGFFLRTNDLQDGACPQCGAPIDGIWTLAP